MAMRMDTAVAGRCRAKQSLPACRSGPATAHSVHPMAGRQCSSAARQVVCRVSVADPPSSTTKQMESQLRSKAPAAGDLNQQIREGHYEAELVQQQAGKLDEEQPSISATLPLLDPSITADVAVVGCGPAGLYLAHQLAQRGLQVALIGNDVPFVNNYGVWVDEFKALGLEHTLERSWPDATCYFRESKPVQVGRAYGRVSRRLLREHLLGLCRQSKVGYLNAEVTRVTVDADGATSSLECSSGQTIRTRLVTLAAGAAAGKFLQYENDAPLVAAQTAYGIEAEVEGYDQAYGGDSMLFMDFRRHHTGLWNNTAPRMHEGNHPNAGSGLWGSSNEVPSFLYAMPLGGSRVFLEETCLVAKPALPFAVLKRRLERRMAAMGVTVKSIHEEEWSYIPVGGPMPLPGQAITAFGAAANLVHPATGFSVSRTLREAPAMADGITAALAARTPVTQTAAAVWDTLWPAERRRQAAFHIFGMELLAQLDLAATNDFFDTFFALPDTYWRGFLGSSLSSAQLLAFAMLTFFVAPPGIKAKLVSFLVSDPAGKYLIRHYKAALSGEGAPQPAAAAAAGAVLLAMQLAATAEQSSA